MDLRNKVAIVTGGAQGLGESIALALLERGCKVSICDVNESKGLKLAESLQFQKHDVIFNKCDVTILDSFEDAFKNTKKAFGKVDILVNNAGIIDEGNWRLVIETNFVGVFHGIQVAFKHIGINNGGSGGCVINAASIAGLSGCSVWPIYTATKHAVVGLTRSFGTDYHLQRTGVTVSAVCPTVISTEMSKHLVDRSVDADHAKKLLENVKFVKPDFVADGVVELIERGKNGALLKIDQNGFEYV